MPNSKLDPNFQRALRGAIQSFRAAKSLWRHHLEEITIMEQVINNDNQTSRELRDNARQACVDINGRWQNWVVGSLLVTYIQAVLNDPRFNVERIYEAVIDEKDETITVQTDVIRKLDDENKKFKNDPRWYADQLRQQLNEKDIILAKATEQQKKSDDLIEKQGKVLEAVQHQLNAREKNYQALYGGYMQTLNEKSTPTTGKKFILSTQSNTGQTCSLSEKESLRKGSSTPAILTTGHSVS